jgi:hypothetical protein
MEVGNYVGMKTFFGGILFLNLASQPVNIAYTNVASTFITSASLSIFQTNTKLYGPSLNRKCIVSYWAIWYFVNPFKIVLGNTTLNNYYSAILTSASTGTRFEG